MNLFELYKFCEYLGSKEISGYSLSPDEFNSNLPIAENRYLKFLVSDLDVTKDISHSLEKFRVELPIINNVVTGKVDKPVDLVYLENASYTYEGKIVDINIVGSAEYKDMVTSVLVNPTAKNPILLMSNAKFSILPKDIVGYDIMYIRKPVTPYMDYFIDESFNINYKYIGSKIIGDGSEFIDVNIDNECYYYWTLNFDYSLSNVIFSLYEDISFTKMIGYARINPANGSIGQIVSNTITGDVTMLQTVNSIAYEVNPKISNIIISKNENNLKRLFYKCYYGTDNKYYFDVYSDSAIKNQLASSSSPTKTILFSQNNIQGTVVLENSWIPKTLNWVLNEPNNGEIIISNYRSSKNGTYNIEIKDNVLTGKTETFMYKNGALMARSNNLGKVPKDIILPLDPTLSIRVNLNYNLLLSQNLSNRVIQYYNNGLNQYSTYFENVYGLNSNNGILYIRLVYTNNASIYTVSVNVYKDAAYSQLLCYANTGNIKDPVEGMISALIGGSEQPEFISFIKLSLTDPLTGLNGNVIVRMFDYANRVKYSTGNSDSTMTYDVKYFTAKNERSFKFDMIFDLEANISDNTIELFGIYKEENNVLIQYEQVDTVESEFTEIDDQIKIAGIMMNMQGINIKDQYLLEYSKQFKPLV